MYILKQKPEDFVVVEINDVKVSDKGKFVYFWMTKIKLNTLQAVEYIAKALKMNSKFINFAGSKDKNAVTTQLISIKGKNQKQVERLNIENISLKFAGYRDDSLHLGELVGNQFKIVIQNAGLIKSKQKYVNYFGVQRLSKLNAPIGKSIVKGDFKTAIELIHKVNSFHARGINEYLATKPNDYVNALKFIPKKILKLYVHAYQSYMWNETVRLFLLKYEVKDNLQVPMIGFGMEIEDNRLKKIIHQIMKVEEISLRDFIIKSLPELSAEGGLRNLYMDIKDFKILEKKSKIIKVSFILGKGSYATEVIRQLFI